MKFSNIITIVSTSLVLILLGLVIMSVLTARNLSDFFRERLTVTVMLQESLSDGEAYRMKKVFQKKPYIHRADYISRQQALKEQTAAMGANPVEFIGANPFQPSYELQLRPDCANTDSLKWISKEIGHIKGVSEVSYPEDLMRSVNDNLNRMNLCLLVLAGLLMFISFALINNTIRLGIYSKRFLIHTMKLVGASWGFIRRPFLLRALLTGLLSSLVALGVLGAGVYYLWLYESGVFVVLDGEVLLITAVGVLLFGLMITVMCCYFSLQKFLKMTAGQLYRI